jgi:hypothetical protein
VQEVIGRKGVDEGGGGLSARPVEPHVKRTSQAEGESTIGGVELKRRETEIEEDAIERHKRLLFSDLGEAGEVGMDKGEAVVDGRVCLETLTASDGVFVGVQGEDHAIRGAGSEDGLGVTATTEGAVKVASTWVGVEGGDGFGEEDGSVGVTLTP